MQSLEDDGQSTALFPSLGEKGGRGEEQQPRALPVAEETHTTVESILQQPRENLPVPGRAEGVDESPEAP